MTDDMPSLTRGERLAAAIEDRKAREAERERQSREKDEAARQLRLSGGGGEECPDPEAPDAAIRLYSKAYRRMWKILDGIEERSATEVQNVVAVFGAARIVAGVGRALAPDDTSSLDFGVLLGGSKPTKGPKV